MRGPFCRGSRAVQKVWGPSYDISPRKIPPSAGGPKKIFFPRCEKRGFPPEGGFQFPPFSRGEKVKCSPRCGNRAGDLDSVPPLYFSKKFWPPLQIFSQEPLGVVPPPHLGIWETLGLQKILYFKPY